MEIFTPDEYAWVLPLKNMGVPLQNFVKIKAPSPMNSLIFTLPLKKSSIFIIYPWRIPWFLNRLVRGGYRYETQ